MGTKRTRSTNTFRQFLIDALCVVFLLGAATLFLVPTISGPGPIRRDEARMALEIENLSQALEAFKAKYGVYPPDMAGDEKEDLEAIETMLERVRQVHGAAADED